MVANQPSTPLTLLPCMPFMVAKTALVAAACALRMIEPGRLITRLYYVSYILAMPFNLLSLAS
jgi:hypothetical protein